MPLRQGENHFTVLQVCTKCWGICCSLCIGGDLGSGALKLEKDFTKLTAGMGHFRRRGKEVYSLHGD